MIKKPYKLKKTDYFLHPEEVLLEKDDKVGLNSASRLEWPIERKLFIILKSLVVVLMGILLGMTLYLQIFKSSYYITQAKNNYLRSYTINAPRGIIYDRYGEPLVLNSSSYSLVMMPLDLPRLESDRIKLSREIAQVLNLDAEEIKNLVANTDLLSIEPVLIKSNLELEEVRKLETSFVNTPGFLVIEDTSRYYPFKEAFSHVVGYVGKLSQSELQKYPDYPLTSSVGKTGLELFYEDKLHGQPGQKIVETNATYTVIKDLGQEDPVKGNDLITTLDSELQLVLFNSLKNQIRDLKINGGAAIALNPKTGEVLALISQPSFDPNIMTKGSPAATINKYLTSSQHPLFNRAVAGFYPPGSLIKPLVGLAALEEKIISPEFKLYDEGKIVIVSPYNKNEKYTFSDWQPHGWVDMREAIAQSCNVYFWTVGGGYGDISGLGWQKLYKWWQIFGLDKKTGIDLVEEINPPLPSPQWLAKTRPQDPTWRVGDTYNVSTGEGGLVLTPIQLVNYVAGIANNGVIRQPHLVNKIQGVDGKIESVRPFKVSSVLPVKPENIKVIQEGMRGVVTYGTASVLKDLPLEAAGKSGSPQRKVNGQNVYEGLFAIYAPYNDPEILLLVVLEKPPNGASDTLPTIREAINWYQKNRLGKTEEEIKNLIQHNKLKQSQKETVPTFISPSTTILDLAKASSTTTTLINENNN